MAFDITKVASNSGSLTSTEKAGVNASVPLTWTYISSVDSIGAIIASGYFNPLSDKISANDMLYISGSDAAGIMQFTTDTGAIPVEVDTFLTTSDIVDGAVTLPKLSAGITPSHVVKFAGVFTSTDVGPTDFINLPGVLVTDLVSVTMKDQGAVPVGIFAALAVNGGVTIEWSADPTNDHILYYVVFRAAT